MEIRRTIARIFQFSGVDPVRPHCRFRVYSSPLLAPFSISLNVRQFCRWLPLTMYGMYPAHHYGCVTMLCYWFCQMWPNVNIPFPTQNPPIIARPRFEVGYPADLRKAICVLVKLRLNYSCVMDPSQVCRVLPNTYFLSLMIITHTYVKWIRYATQASAGKMMNNPIEFKLCLGEMFPTTKK